MEDNQTFLQHIYDKRKVLLLYDGADKLDFLQSYLPRSTAFVHVLITTRSGSHALLDRADKVISLGRLKTDSAVKALQAWRGRPHEELLGEEAKSAACLVSERPVEGLPLPIAHAGTYMRKTKVGCSQYYRLLKTRQEKLEALVLDIEKLLHYFQISHLRDALSKRGVHNPNDLKKPTVEEKMQSIAVEPEDRHLLRMARNFVMTTDHVHLTWQLDIENVKETDDDAMELLLFASFLASKNIPERLLHPLVFTDVTAHRYCKSLSTLISHTLIDVSASNEGNTINLHPLVQSTVFERLLSQPEELCHKLARLSQHLLSLLPWSDDDIKQSLRNDSFLSLVPHLYATAEKVGKCPLSEESGLLLDLACRVALILQHVDVAVDLCHEHMKLFSVSDDPKQRFYGEVAL